MTKSRDFLRKLINYGERHLGVDDPRSALMLLHQTQGMSLTDIAGLFKVTRQNVGYWADKLRVPTRPQGRQADPEARARALGFKTLAAFFSQHGEKPVREQARLLGISPPVVGRYYDEYVASKRR